MELYTKVIYEPIGEYILETREKVDNKLIIKKKQNKCYNKNKKQR